MSNVMQRLMAQADHQTIVEFDAYLIRVGGYEPEPDGELTFWYIHNAIAFHGGTSNFDVSVLDQDDDVERPKIERIVRSASYLGWLRSRGYES